jgi:hypothetical protein
MRVGWTDASCRRASRFFTGDGGRTSAADGFSISSVTIGRNAGVLSKAAESSTAAVVVAV